MTFNNKQLEEIDNIYISSDSFLDESFANDEDLIANQNEEIAFRREMLERALQKIKLAKINGFPDKNQCSINDIIYESSKKKFARIKNITKSSILIKRISTGEEISIKTDSHT
ncbi:MAG: hypothetical protein HYS16_00460 [Deltaproteobacteria bacterium]|nr:MAG: hypothetical protein HYS16_00460 [Deltaproteobacteria bacterium]